MFSTDRKRASKPLITRNSTHAERDQERCVSEQLVLAAEDLADRVVDEDPADRVGQQLGAGQHADVVRAVRGATGIVSVTTICSSSDVAQVLEGVAGEDGVRGGRVDARGALLP